MSKRKEPGRTRLISEYDDLELATLLDLYDAERRDLELRIRLVKGEIKYRSFKREKDDLIDLGALNREAHKGG